MWYKKSIIPVAALLVAASTFSANQAYALSDDEAAVLVGLAVGTVEDTRTYGNRTTSSIIGITIVMTASIAMSSAIVTVPITMDTGGHHSGWSTM